MKLRYIAVGLNTLFFAGNIFGQTKMEKWSLLPYLNDDCISNIVITADLAHPKPCSLIQTNLLSNANLFSLAEQKMLKEIPLKYKNVTTNSGPLGSILAGLERKTNGDWIARFQYTNSEAIDEVRFGLQLSAKFRTKAGDGYDVNLDKPDIHGISLFDFRQVNQNGVTEGLVAAFYGEHCHWWMHYVNGKAVGKWLVWDVWNKKYMNHLCIEAEFKEPFDYDKYFVPN